MRFVPAILLGIGLLWPHAEPAWAHGDEVHGESNAARRELLPAGLGNGGVGDLFEAVVTPANDGYSRLYLSEAASNAPVAEAKIDVEVAGSAPWTGQGEATPQAGVYRLSWIPPLQGSVDLTLTVFAAYRSDVILIQIPERAEATNTPSTPVFQIHPVGVGLLAVVVAVGWWLRRSRRKSGVAALVLVLLAGVTTHDAQAHGDEIHGAAEPQPTAALSPSERRVELPKASQFLLELRTVPATVQDMAESIRLVGRVIPDPAAHARIHPSVPSRIGHDPDFPPPTSGQWVKRGQTLAVLDPVLSITEKNGQRLALSRGERPEATVGREMILAPMDGQLTDLHIVPGEVVTEDTTLVEIIDPARLWVEAILYDLSLATRIRGGTAVTRQLPGKVFPLLLAGVSPKVNPENQGLHLQFAVTESLGLLKPGMPLDVYAQTGTIPKAITVPRGAVLDQGGRALVWVKSAPETFEAQQVRVGRRTAEWAEILEGIQPGDKVVVQGHNQLNAMR